MVGMRVTPLVAEAPSFEPTSSAHASSVDGQLGRSLDCCDAAVNLCAHSRVDMSFLPRRHPKVELGLGESLCFTFRGCTAAMSEDPALSPADQRLLSVILAVVVGVEWDLKCGFDLHSPD